MATDTLVVCTASGLVPASSSAATSFVCVPVVVTIDDCVPPIVDWSVSGHGSWSMSHFVWMPTCQQNF